MSERSAEESIYDSPQSPRQGSPTPAGEPSEPHPGSGAPEPEQPVRSFPDKHRQALTGLMYLGRLEEDFEWLGHRFVIRTLTAGEQVNVGVLIQSYKDTRGEWQAYQAAYVAAAVVSVDDVPLSTPVDTTADPLAEHRHRFTRIMRDWYSPTIDAVYRRVKALEHEVRLILESMGKVGG